MLPERAPSPPSQGGGGAAGAAAAAALPTDLATLLGQLLAMLRTIAMPGGDDSKAQYLEPHIRGLTHDLAAGPFADQAPVREFVDYATYLDTRSR